MKEAITYDSISDNTKELVKTIKSVKKKHI